MPRAYVIGQFEVHNPEGYEEYRSQTPATIAKFGGRFIVRGGRVRNLEGDAPFPRIVVIEFPSLEQAEAWYDSEDYQRLIPIRQERAVGRSFIVEGVED